MVEKLSDKNLYYRFSVRYANQNRKALVKQFPSFEQFRKTFNAGPELLDGFSQFCVDEGQPIIWKDLTPKVLKYSEVMLKANIARALWDESEYLAVINERDPTFVTALQALEQDKLKDMVSAK